MLDGLARVGGARWDMRAGRAARVRYTSALARLRQAVGGPIAAQGRAAARSARMAMRDSVIEVSCGSACHIQLTYAMCAWPVWRPPVCPVPKVRCERVELDALGGRRGSRDIESTHG